MVARAPLLQQDVPVVELANTDTAGAVNQRLLLQSSGDDGSSVSQEPEFITAASVAAAPCNSGDKCAEVFFGHLLSAASK